MNYSQIRDRVVGLDGVGERSRADAIIRTVMGLIASRLDDATARQLAAQLPEAISFDAMRKSVVGLECRHPEDAVDSLADRFGLSPTQAKHLFREVTRAVRAVCGDSPFHDISRALPDDWHALVGR